MKKECTNCENENLMRVAELEIENDRLKDWKFRLEKTLEYEQEINKLLREENEELQNKLRVYQTHCQQENKYEIPETDEVLNSLNNLSAAIKQAKNSFQHNDFDSLQDIL